MLDLASNVNSGKSLGGGVLLFPQRYSLRSSFHVWVREHLPSSASFAPSAGRSVPANPPGRPMISSLPPPSSSGHLSLERRGSTDSHSRKEKKKKRRKDKDNDKPANRKVTPCYRFSNSWVLWGFWGFVFFKCTFTFFYCYFFMTRFQPSLSILAIFVWCPWID